MRTLERVLESVPLSLSERVKVRAGGEQDSLIPGFSRLP